MYEIEYNSKVKKYGVYRLSPYLQHKLLCAVFDDLESALLYVVRALTPKIDKEVDEPMNHFFFN